MAIPDVEPLACLFAQREACIKAPKTWDKTWDDFVASSLPAPIAQMFVGQLGPVVIGGTAGSALLLALAMAHKRKGKHSLSSYFRKQIGMLT